MKCHVLTLGGLLLAVFTGGLAQASPYSDAVLADNPFAYYRFEELSGTTATNSGSMGAAGNGTYVNSPTLGTTLIGAPVGLGNSVGLVGSPYVDVPSLGGNHSQLSVEAWVNTNGVAGGCCTSIFHTDSWGNNALGRSLHYNIKGGRDIEHATNGGGPSNVNSPVNTIVDNTWQHLVTTYDATTGDVEFYVDGASVGSGTHGSMGDINLSDTGQIGAWNGGRLLPGNVDEFAFYDSVLTPQQVQSHFNAADDIGSPGGPAVPEPASIAIWTLIGLALGGFGYCRRKK